MEQELKCTILIEDGQQNFAYQGIINAAPKITKSASYRDGKRIVIELKDPIGFGVNQLGLVEVEVIDNRLQPKVAEVYKETPPVKKQIKSKSTSVLKIVE